MIIIDRHITTLTHTLSLSHTHTHTHVTGFNLIWNNSRVTKHIEPCLFSFLCCEAQTKEILLVKFSIKSSTGLDSIVGIVTLGAGQSGNWMLKGVRFYTYVQTDPAPHPSQPPVQWVLGLFPIGWSYRSVVLTAHPDLAPRLKKEYSNTSTPTLFLLALFLGELPSPFLLVLKLSLLECEAVGG
jgi:hypothetical protein